MSRTVAAEADALAQSIIELVRHRSGRLAAVTVQAPARWAGAALGAMVADRLAARGYAGVAVQIQRGPELRVASVELDR